MRPATGARRVAFGAFVLAVALTGCRSCSRRECEPSALRAHCAGETLVFCAEQGSAYGYDFGTRIARTTCGVSAECIDDHAGAAACVHRPATRCDEATWPGACDGEVPLVCLAPSPSVREGYVVEGSRCVGDTTCALTPFGASCVKDGVPCPLPEGRISDCVGRALVVCGPGKHGRIETLRVDCGCEVRQTPDGNTVGLCSGPEPL